MPKLKLEGLEASSVRSKFTFRELGKNSLKSKVELEVSFIKKIWPMDKKIIFEKTFGP